MPIVIPHINANASSISTCVLSAAVALTKEPMETLVFRAAAPLYHSLRMNWLKCTPKDGEHVTFLPPFILDHEVDVRTVELWNRTYPVARIINLAVESIFEPQLAAGAV